MKVGKDGSDGSKSPMESLEQSDHNSNDGGGGTTFLQLTEILPTVPMNWSADVKYEREVISLLSLYEKAPRQLGCLKCGMYTSTEEEGHNVSFSINARRENRETRRVVEFKSRVIHRSVKVPSHFRIEHVSLSTGRELSYNVDISSRNPSALKEVVANYRCGLREASGIIKPYTTAQAESLAKVYMT